MDEDSVIISDSQTPAAKQRPLTSSNTYLVCLNFKVPFQVRQQFKIYAARQDMTMTELLLKLLDDYFVDQHLLSAATRPPEVK